MHPSDSSAASRPLPCLPSRYRSIRLLGSGGMASVWCAHDTMLGRRVAVKLLSEALSGDPQASRRFLREARAAARLSGHPHVVTIFDVGDHESCPYMVMEHLAGGTVADAIRLRAHSQAEALCWIEQAAQALDYAHAHGIVHRDVKPANMLLGSDRRLRLGDFGIASLGTEQTLPSGAAIYATAAYISPEQALGHSATPASDRYALAVCAFELLTGERPYAAATATEQARAHVQQPPPRATWRAPELPEAIDEVLARGMAKAAGERWQTAGELAQALRDALEPRAEGHRPGAMAAAARLALAPSPALAPPPYEARPDVGQQPRMASAHPRAHQASAGREARLKAPGRRQGASARRRAVLMAAVALASAAGGIAVGSQHDGAPAGIPAAKGWQLRAGTQASRRARPHARASAPQPRRHVAPAPSAVALEAEGHQLMLDGDYAQALPVLREAVRRADPSSLTYAYALFDLGRTLRLDGQPAAAIAVLERRLQIPNQPQVVAYELALAREQAAQQSTASAQQAAVNRPLLWPGRRGRPDSERHATRQARAPAGQQTDLAVAS